MSRLSLDDEKRKWFVLLAVFTSGALIVGINGYSFGFFIEPLEKEFGWTREQISLGFSSSFISSLLAPLIGRFVDLKGSKFFLVLSLFLIALGFLLRPFMSNITHWILLNILVFAGYPGALFFSVGVLIQVWFPTTRGRMVALATSGRNIGGVIFPLLTFTMLFFLNWKATYFSYGLIFLGLGIFTFLFIENSPIDNIETQDKNICEKDHDFKEDIRSAKFIFLAFGTIFGTFSYYGVLPQIVPHLQIEGLSPKATTFALVYISAMGALNKLFFGRLSERHSSLLLTVFSIFLQIVGLTVILIADGRLLLVWVGILIFGMGFGSIGALVSLNINECFGLKCLSRIWGSISFLGVWSTFLVPWMMGKIFMSTGSYSMAHGIIIGFLCCSILFLLIAKVLNKKNFPLSCRE
jgi:MFS family permease